MKVLHILDSLNRGGAEMLMLDICRNAERNGLELHFLATGGGALEGDFKVSGVPVHRLQRRLPLDPLLVLELRGVFQRERFDIIHNYQAVAGIHSWFASIGLGAKNVLGFQGFYGDFKNHWATKFLVPRMDANISCSTGLINWLRDTEGIDVSDFKVVFNGADPSRLTADGTDLKTELGLPPDAFLFGMLAHFYRDPRKDQSTLCRAFVDIAASLPNAHLILAGKTESGAERKREECEQICREAGLGGRVHFLGFREDAPRIVAALDVNVLSSLHEGFPVSLVEAMLVGKACLLSDIPPHIEASEQGRYAELFRTGDAADLAKEMMKLAEDDVYRADLAERSRAHALETLSIRAHIQKLKTIYESIT